MQWRRVRSNKIDVHVSYNYYIQVNASHCVQEPQFFLGGFVHMFTCSHIDLTYVHVTQCILSGFVIVTMRHINWADETEYKV